MGIIRELPASVVNQIAAGEVVERPASVVKELLENAIDAGATAIELSVERGGKDLVRVADNGAGITRDDLPLAFRPHATSKLATADDLISIATLGFRGEALAAIAEISKLRCQTRTAGDAAGSEITIDAGIAGPIGDCGCPPGTVIEVRNLFFNTPVRRTFLKSDSTEAGHVVEMFTRVALAHPNVHLSYRSGGKLIHDLPSTTGLKERIGLFFGRELADSLLWVESRIDGYHLWGYVGHPAQSRSNNKAQYLFVGGRYVRDRALSHALAEAYRGLLMVGRSPVAFLYLNLPPEDIDVNVHPTKIEVRFRDSQRLYSQLLATVRKTFLATDLHTRLQTPQAADHTEPASAMAESNWSNEAASTPLPLTRPAAAAPAALASAPADRQSVVAWFPQAGSSSGAGAAFLPRPEPAWVETLPPRPNPPAPLELPFDEFGVSSSATPSAEPVRTVSNGSDAHPLNHPALSRSRAIQVHDSYLIAETEEGVVVIDQHALHERILYEELKGKVEHGGVEAQQLLVPEPVELTAADAAAILERKEVLARLGLGVEPFGGGTVLVTRAPALLAQVPAERLLRDLADRFREEPLDPTADDLLEDVLNMVACKAAIKANQRLSPQEIDALLERRQLAANTHHCPHGRPAALVFTKHELEKQFGRT